MSGTAMRTVSQVSALTGVSVRTLHHYDAIGLLPPTRVTDAGYRLYDDAALCRLQSILMLRELQFPLGEIRAILDSPDYDPLDAVARQADWLEARCRRMEELVALAREIQRKGEFIMDFHAFDDRETARFREEAKEKWGATAAYREYEARAAAGGNGDTADAATGLMAVFRDIGELRDQPVTAPAVRAAVRGLQEYITAHFYTCTDEILRGLGETYTADERFRQNIDRAGGEGTAVFTRRAIEALLSAPEERD